MSVLISNARVLTLARGERPRRGPELGVLAAINRASVLVEDGRIARVFGPEGPPAGTGGSVERVIDARERVLMPAFIDCHTHACWAGDRLDEGEMKKQGAT